VTHVKNLLLELQKTGQHNIKIFDTTFHKNGTKKSIIQSIWEIMAFQYQPYDVIYINASIYFTSLVKLGLLLKRMYMGSMPTKKVFVKFHGGSFHNIRGTQKRYLQLLLTGKIRSQVDSFMFLTEEQKQEFQNRFPCDTDKLKLSFNCVKVEPDYPAKDFSVLKVLFLSRMEKAKGIYEFIEAARELSGRPNIRFFIAGSGTEEKNVEKAVNKMSNTTYIGAVKGDIKERLIKECNVFCLLSEAEAVPYALLENMAWGNIPIVTDVGRMKQIVETQQSGYVINKNSKELLQVIERLASDQEAALEKSYKAYLTIKEMQEGENIDQCLQFLQNGTLVL